MNRYSSMVKHVLALAALLIATSSQAQQYQDGVHYTKLDVATNPAASGTIGVTEIFSYACHACSAFEPYIQNWKARQAEDVTLDRLPVGFGRRAWELLAQGYMIAEILGIEEEAHMPMMTAIWEQGQQFRSLDDLAGFYANHGTTREQFLALSEGFTLAMKQKQHEARLRTYAPRQTPTMIVNGKYKIQTGGAVPSYEEMLKIVDYLVAQERAAMTAASE